MAFRSLTDLLRPASRLLDAVMSRTLRYDQSRKDVLNWIRFARNLFLMLVVAVVTIGGLAGFAASRQGRQLLEASLRAQGEAVAAAVARASFVPLSLEDDAALETLLASYGGTPDIVSLRVRDARGRTRMEAVFDPGTAADATMSIEAAVAPVASAVRRGAPKSVAGMVTVVMSTRRLRAESRHIALLNLGGVAVLSLVVLGVGLMLMRPMIERMRELLGEAKLAQALAAANRELEAFSYSVSHDLRAPLRTVDGFSHIVLEDYGDRLDDQGRDYLNRIRAGCQRMGQLIDDLLKLARVIRHELRTADADLAAVARGVVDQLRQADPARAVEVSIPERLPARCDPGLIRAALDNLIGNAWKFTGKQPDARIEFGVESRPEGAVYFVRDNGAGFDMAYAGKLFGAFQRLHTQGEFAGTGIGLATVQRIVQRHGGRVWAESTVGQGATFRLTLSSPRSAAALG